MKKITIAGDGYSSCGKSTMAKALARKLEYIYIDTGAMYRAVTLFCMNSGILQGDKIDTERLEKALPEISIEFRTLPGENAPQVYLNGECVEKEIRSMRVSEKVSLVSAIPSVREAMVKLQREMGAKKGVIMDGRDIGTTVFPDAELKIFVTASPEIRARRRLDELKAKGSAVTFEEVLKNVQERDYMDCHREVSPLRKADDAITLDNTCMTIEQQDEWLMQQYRKAAE